MSVPKRVYPSLLKTSERHFWQATLRNLQLLPGFSVGSADKRSVRRRTVLKRPAFMSQPNILMPYATRNHTKQPKVVITSSTQTMHATKRCSSAAPCSSPPIFVALLLQRHETSSGIASRRFTLDTSEKVCR